MSQVSKVIPLHSHATMSFAFKEKCVDVYNRICENKGLEDTRRDLGLRNTIKLNPRILTACVDFLSFGKMGKSDLLNPHLPTGLKKYLPQPLAHHKGCMDLRLKIGAGSFEAWNETHVHYWSDFDRFFGSLSSLEQSDVDSFFKLMIDQDYTSFRSEHLVNVDNSLQTREPQEWTTSEHISGPVRSDVAANFFTVIAGEMVSATPNGHNHYSPLDFVAYPSPCPSDYLLRRLTENGHEYPRLKPATSKSVGVPCSNLSDAVTLAMSAGVKPGFRREVAVEFMGVQILRGDVCDAGFNPDLITPWVDHSKTVSRAMIMDAIEVSEPLARIEARFDNLLAIEMGLCPEDNTFLPSPANALNVWEDDLGL